MERKAILEPAKIVTEPGKKYAWEAREWQGCPTIARTARGRLWAGWYSGGIIEPDERNYNLLVYSDDEGFTWSEPVLVIDSRPEINLRAMDIQLWIDPEGSLRVFWTQTGESQERDEAGRRSWYCDDIFGIWEISTPDADTDRPVWTKPVRISDGFLRCRPTVLSDSRIIMCPYDWVHDRYAYNISEDGGRTWKRFFGAVKAGDKKWYDEAMVVERKDGVLWMLARTNQEGALAQTFSNDGGKTWLPVGVSGIENPSSRFWIGRLRSGRLLLINHHAFTGRDRLAAFLSEDDGETWPWYLLLDKRANVSYPDVVECPDGSILCIYDRERVSIGEILMARFTEADIFSGKLVAEGSYLKRKISACRKCDFTIEGEMGNEE